MKTLYWSPARSSEQVTRFVDLLIRDGGYDIPDYFRTAHFPHCEIHTLNSEDEMIGGFALAPGHEVVCLKALPARVEQAFWNDNEADKVIELNGVWLAPSERGGAAAYELWTALGRVLGAREDVDKIVYSVDSSKLGLLRLYEKVAQGVIYDDSLELTGQPLNMKVFWSTPAVFDALPRLYTTELQARM